MINLTNNFKFKNVELKSFVNLSKNEIELVRRWRNTKWVRSWMYSSSIIPKTEHSEFIKSLKKEKRNFYWIVTHDKKACGIIYLNRVDKVNKNAFLGIYKDPVSNKDGVGKILMDSLKYIAFRKAGLYTLKLEVASTNDKAMDFYKKSGFLVEGRLRNFMLINNKRVDVIIMGFFKSAFRKY